MDQENVEALAQRLSRYERSNRRWKAFGMLGVSSVGLVLLVGWADKKPVPFESDVPVVIKAGGKVRVRLGANDAGTGQIQLYGSDQDGTEEKARAVITIASDNPEVHLYSK